MNEEQPADRDARARHAETLLPELYDELRRLASARLDRLRPGQTLQATALVHEAYMKLVRRGDPGWNGEGHFFGAAANAMREILVDQARRKGSIKHGGGHGRVEFDEDFLAGASGGYDLTEIDGALRKLEEFDRRKAEIVTMRFFGGLSVEQIAAALDISTPTVKRDWAFAKLWLRRELSTPNDAEPQTDAG